MSDQIHAGLTRRRLAGFMTKAPNPFRWFDSSPEVIRLVTMMYVRYPLSLRSEAMILVAMGANLLRRNAHP